VYVCEQQKHIRDETRAGKFNFIVYYVFRLRKLCTDGDSGSGGGDGGEERVPV